MDMDHPPVEDEEAEKMETDEPVADGEQKEKKKTRTKKEAEPPSETLSNLSRVLPAQLKYITFPDGSRFLPVKKVRIFKIIRLIVAHWWGVDYEGYETGRGS